jgi:multiple sugar transport system substrate-binding protein
MSRKLHLLLALLVVVSVTFTSFGIAAVSAATPFDWQQAKGTTVNLLMVKHGYTDSMLNYLPDFEKATGIKVVYTIVPEEQYFEKVSMDLAGKAGGFDVFMVGAYHTWTYAPQGGMEPLETYINDPKLTSADWNFEDIFPSLRKSLQWNMTPGGGLGEGHQWALPWGFETNALMYRYDRLQKAGIAVPKTWADLGAAAQKLTGTVDGKKAYGIAQRGSKSWATIHPGYLTGFATYGAADFDKNMKCTINSQAGIDFTDMWVKMVKSSGPPGWTVQTWMENMSDMKAGVTSMYLDADIATALMSTKDVPELWGQDGKTLLHVAPAPVGPAGTFKTNMWIWSLAMNAASKNKVGAWLWMQYFTGPDYIKKATVEHWQDNPIRQTGLSNPLYAKKMENYPTYLDTLAVSVANSGIFFTPEPEYAFVGDQWAAGLHDIYSGSKTTKAALDDVCKAIDQHMTEVGITK